jgi:hypothetical protein
MKIRLLSLAAAALLACGVQAATAQPSYAVISLVGDKLDIVTFQPQIGSQLDNNTHKVLSMPQDELDIAALRAVNHALRATTPDAPVALLAASTPDSFADQDRIFSGSHVNLPAEVDAAVRREGATQLVLVTKHRGDARLRMADGYVGSGKIDGLGFYLDTELKTEQRQTEVRSVGYIAPFVYVDVSLVDLATSTLVRQDTVMASRAIGASNKESSVHPWDALTSAEKLAMLNTLLSEELQRIVPSLITGTPVKAQ